ncbi:helix-turn-helix domain-containing protein [Litoreibacter roseus]|uniref:HTH cro/C1-type domain-containing protein n=1 Tax=Litoreibacter roseus TaxID=2601869 RepID=A0A6N6JHN3_9RHOB|nr:hypothetical protein KIN_26980 [Litoreibacter roseus]
MPHPVDLHLGRKLRQQRWLSGMTQSELGQAVGIRFQQIQKYEAGTNRISASRLWDMAQVLGVPVGVFFDGLSSDHEDDGFDDAQVQGVPAGTSLPV